ncbi:sugar ABC transporter ATP-binding protein [Paraoerskovia sediminicola]|uniref:Sugar ABC transporter ATP-binding protein n=1 Tax=Paraoerskovia sediminicola TaxID=1138587 RepID=A0ABN6X9R2_9CELL|nr:carbohydrate ABC transporter permease [Paraoerskovia sediminicola]BDZ41469.1 sugar ABC transporter ATP-binding protein [Paraoerskovia sediminicola]
MSATTAATLPVSQIEGGPVVRGPRRPTPAKRAGRGVLYVVLALAAAAVLLPFVWMVISSLKTNNDVFTVPIQWIPDPFVWNNYVEIWQKSDMTTWIKNTLILSVSVTFLQVLTGSFAAYGFSKVRFAGRDALFLIYVATIAVPWQAYMIPQFVMLSKIGLSNTLWAILALQTFGAFGVFLMKQFFETVPEELSEAARIDGLSEYGIWRRIMIPLSVPAIASLTLITFTNTWNDYLGPLIYLRSPDLWTLQLGLKTFIGQYNADYALIMTGSVISVLPIAIIFLAGQRYFIEGIATSGLKG